MNGRSLHWREGEAPPGGPGSFRQFVLGGNDGVIWYCLVTFTPVVTPTCHHRPGHSKLAQEYKRLPELFSHLDVSTPSFWLPPFCSGWPGFLAQGQRASRSHASRPPTIPNPGIDLSIST